MRFWDVSGPEVEAADAEPWDGPLAGLMRPFSTNALLWLTFTSGILYGGGTVAAGLVLLTTPDVATYPAALWGVDAFAALLTIAIFVTPGFISPHMIRHIAPAVGFFAIQLSTVLITASVVCWGPPFGSLAAAAYVEAPLFAFYMLRRRWAVLNVALVMTAFGVILAFQDGWEAPSGQWVFLFSTVGATSILMGVIAERADLLATSEHEARVELADLNHTLEDRVDEQVTEIERLGGLRRFLSPQVADAVLSGESEELTHPHRRRIAVFCCDLRGFTAFTNNAEPEEVIGVLEEYYGAVGRLLQRYDATVGDYAGDGIMAYFGDPVPRADSALAAVEMTCEIGRSMAPVVAEWQRGGYHLDYGVGLAFGYATLGVVGFDGRYDYKPVGGVVNLASRLCARAGAGQVLLDHPTYAATSDRFASEHVADLDLKGYGAPTPAYALTAG